MRKKPVFSNDKKKPVSPRSTEDVDTERDLDEQIHSRELIGGEPNNEDPDDKVHKPKPDQPKQLNAEDHPKDPDDLIHENSDDDDEL